VGVEFCEEEVAAVTIDPGRRSSSVMVSTVSVLVPLRKVSVVWWCRGEEVGYIGWGVVDCCEEALLLQQPVAAVSDDDDNKRSSSSSSSSLRMGTDDFTQVKKAIFSLQSIWIQINFVYFFSLETYQTKGGALYKRG
jgi:hypothetical protein